MKKKAIPWVQVILIVAAIVFICISIFGDHTAKWPVTGCLICIIAANMFRFVRMRYDLVDEEKREQENKEKEE